MSANSCFDEYDDFPAAFRKYSTNSDEFDILRDISQVPQFQLPNIFRTPFDSNEHNNFPSPISVEYFSGLDLKSTFNTPQKNSPQKSTPSTAGKSQKPKAKNRFEENIRRDIGVDRQPWSALLNSGKTGKCKFEIPSTFKFSNEKNFGLVFIKTGKKELTSFSKKCSNFIQKKAKRENFGKNLEKNKLSETKKSSSIKFVFSASKLHFSKIKFMKLVPKKSKIKSKLEIPVFKIGTKKRKFEELEMPNLLIGQIPKMKVAEKHPGIFRFPIIELLKSKLKTTVFSTTPSAKSSKIYLSNYKSCYKENNSCENIIVKRKLKKSIGVFDISKKQNQSFKKLYPSKAICASFLSTKKIK